MSIAGKYGCHSEIPIANQPLEKGRALETDRTRGIEMSSDGRAQEIRESIFRL